MKNMDLTLDCDLNINEYVFNVARICYFELRRLGCIRVNS